MDTKSHAQCQRMIGMKRWSGHEPVFIHTTNVESANVYVWQLRASRVDSARLKVYTSSKDHWWRVAVVILSVKLPCWLKIPISQPVYEDRRWCGKHIAAAVQAYPGTRSLQYLICTDSMYMHWAYHVCRLFILRKTSQNILQYRTTSDLHISDCWIMISPHPISISSAHRAWSLCSGVALRSARLFPESKNISSKLRSSDSVVWFQYRTQEPTVMRKESSQAFSPVQRHLKFSTLQKQLSPMSKQQSASYSTLHQVTCLSIITVQT